ncbi:MAG: hypothetical protein IPK85_04730 [Gemmatimonadetes bacterium]|nr:hypothetical protein [Gemmatimonadota bacterium]
MAFNYLAWKLGPETALESQFDDARRYVRYAKRGESWPYAQRMYPEEEGPRALRLTMLPGEGHRVRFRSFHDDFFVSLTSPETLHSWAAGEVPDAGLL